MSITPTRRSVVRTAAWTVPAVTVAGAAPQFAASTMEHQSVVKTFRFSDAMSNTVTVQVTARIPQDVHPGEPLEVATTTSVINISDGTRIMLGTFLLFSPTFVGGTSESTIVYSGVLSTSATTRLTIATTEFPDQGPLVLTATGTPPASMVPVGTPAGEVTLTLDEASSVLIGYEADGTTETNRYTSVLTKLASEDYTLGTFTVHDA